MRPDAVAARGHRLRDVRGRHALDVEQERRQPSVHRLLAVHRHRVGQRLEEAAAELVLVRAQDLHAAERLEVRDRRREAGEELVRRGAGLEAAADRRVRRRSCLVRPPRLEQLVASVCDPEVRAAELVRGSDEHVAIDRLHVHRLVRGVLHRVEPGQRAHRVRELGHALHVDDRPQRVRRGDGRDDARALVELPLQVVEVETQVVGDVDPVHLEAAVGRELEPRRDAAVVVEAADEDAVALLPVARRGARQREVEHGHVRPEDDVVGRAVEEAAGVGARAVDDLLDPATGLVRRAEVAARVAQRVRDRLADLVRHLRAARCVEEGEASAQRGEALP